MPSDLPPDSAPTEEDERRDAALVARVVRRRRRRVLLFSALLSLLLVGGALWTTHYAAPDDLAPPTAPLPAQARVDAAAPIAAFPKQGPDECGAFSLACAARLLTGEAVSGAEVARAASVQVAGSRALSGTRPWSLLAEARRRGLAERGCTARSWPSERRHEAVLAQLAAGRPVIVLMVSDKEVQHYVLALGYGDGGVDLYDPALDASDADEAKTVDKNGERAGNRTMSFDIFRARWGRGGVAGLYTWWYLPLDRPAGR